MSYNNRNRQWNPPPTQDYIVGAGASLGLTDDGDGFKFGFDDGDVDTILKNLCLFDGVSKLEYDASSFSVTIQYEIGAGVTTNKDVQLEFNHQFVKIGDDFESGTVNTLTNTISVDGLTAGDLAEINLGNVSGAALARVMKTNLRRQGASGLDDFTGEFFIIGWVFKRI